MSIETIPTGIRGLDDVLLGGVSRGNVILVEGAAGSGKTSLGLEFIYRGALEHDSPGLVVSFEIAPQRLMRDAQGFRWDFADLEARRRAKIIYTSPVVLLQELQSGDGVLAREIAELGARRVLIDGLTPVKVVGEALHGSTFRDRLHLLVEMLQHKDVTALITREVPALETARASQFSDEHFVCDTIIALRAEPRGRSVLRSLEIIKSRGQDFITGQHTMRIEEGQGVRVYPRASARPRVLLEQPTSSQRSSVGVEAIDEMMGNGLYDGSITLCVGVSGTGKTLLGLQFLVEGAKQGKKGLLVSLDEHPAQIVRNAEGLDLQLQKYIDAGLVHIYYEAPQELELDVHYWRIASLVAEHGFSRVVVDSLAAYAAHEEDEREFRDFVYALSTYFKDRLITAFLNFESPELLGVSQISQDIKASPIVDNIVLLNYVEVSNRLRRAMTVPKARGSAPRRDTREYVIGRGGISLVPSAPEERVPQLPFSSYYGVLARAPERRSPIIEERVLKGEPLPKTTAADDGLGPRPRSSARVPSKKKARPSERRR